jgi:MATE family multidrug resistance protein
MRLNTSYRQILSISVPIMLASATQNVIVLCDNIFLNSVSRLDFAAVGIVGVFYLMIASIGYGFSRGGQIIIARRAGQREYRLVGNCFQALLIFEMILAFLMFLFLQFGTPWLFGLLIENPIIYQKCLEYIIPRSYGVFFSYIGVTLISLYTGIARTKFIIYTALVLTLVNIFLNYALIFGRWGFPEMGIAGAGWASTLAEIVSFIMFSIYMLFDTRIRKYKLLDFSSLKLNLITQVGKLSYPIVLQSLIGLGSWFIFFAMIENIGANELSISNLIRNIYLILSIPCWGFSAGINTIVSGFVGLRKRQAVLPMVKKTALLSMLVTVGLTIPILIAPRYILYPFFGTEDMSLINDTIPYLPLLLLILATFSAGTIYMNGLIGLGKTQRALWIQASMTVFYVIYVYLVLKVFNLGIGWGWFSEVIYWFAMMLIVSYYLTSNKWKLTVR